MNRSLWIGTNTTGVLLIINCLKPIAEIHWMIHVLVKNKLYNSWWKLHLSWQIAALRKSGDQDNRARARTFSSMEPCTTNDVRKRPSNPNNTFNHEEEIQQLRDILKRVGKLWSIEFLSFSERRIAIVDDCCSSMIRFFPHMVAAFWPFVSPFFFLGGGGGGGGGWSQVLEEWNWVGMDQEKDFRSREMTPDTRRRNGRLRRDLFR